MTVEVISYVAPDIVRDAAYEFLQDEPVLNNLVLTLLEARVAHPQPGRYWIAREGRRVAGLGLQSPIDYQINLSVMMPDVAVALADAIAAERCDLPAAAGEARVVARFAGQWAERCKAGVHPDDGQRIYEARTIMDGATAPGRMERAGEADRPLLCDWVAAFQAEVGGPAGGVEAFVERRVAAGEIWLWKNDGARCMAARTAAVAGVSRVQYIYTPPRDRRHGYAETLARDLTRQLLDAGLRPMLFTELSNATSNAIYRRVGYQAVAELVRYRFDRPTGALS